MNNWALEIHRVGYGGLLSKDRSTNCQLQPNNSTPLLALPVTLQSTVFFTFGFSAFRLFGFHSDRPTSPLDRC
jgi:hypothetical protein